MIAIIGIILLVLKIAIPTTVAYGWGLPILLIIVGFVVRIIIAVFLTE